MVFRFSQQREKYANTYALMQSTVVKGNRNADSRRAVNFHTQRVRGSAAFLRVHYLRLTQSVSRVRDEEEHWSHCWRNH